MNKENHVKRMLNDLEDQLDLAEKKIETAKKVYKAFEDDGVYGAYALGEDLWNEFEKQFKDTKGSSNEFASNFID